MTDKAKDPAPEPAYDLAGIPLTPRAHHRGLLHAKGQIGPPAAVVAQLIGAALACLFLLAVFGNVEHLGATLPGPGYANWQAFLMEVVLTAILVSVVLGNASAAQNVGAIAALGVGGYIALAGLWSAPVSGGFSSYWVYVAGPVAGALIAVGCAIEIDAGDDDPSATPPRSDGLGSA